MLNRRTGTIATLALYLALGAGCASTYIRDNVLRQAASEGKIVADLHVHPNKVNSLEEICETMSMGVMGLVRINGWENGRKDSTIFIYEDAAKLDGFKEIDKDRFASFTYKGRDGKTRTGYVLKCQELTEAGVGDAPGFHILAVGIDSYVYDIKQDDTKVPLEEKFRRYVEAIHRRGGLAIYAHPYVLSSNGIALFTLASPGQEKIIRARAVLCDGIETFNGQAAVDFLFVGDFNQGNEKANKLASESGKPGISTTDSHIALGNAYRCGIKFPANEMDEMNWEKLKTTIITGNYKCVENYSSTIAFAFDNRRFAWKCARRLPKAAAKNIWNLATLIPRVIYNIVTCDHSAAPSTQTQTDTYAPVEQKQQPINTSSN